MKKKLIQRMGPGVTAAMLACTVVPQVAAGAVLGDANGDGKADIGDAMLIARSVAGLAPPVDPRIGDVDCDGRVAIMDALQIAQLSAGLIQRLPCAYGVTISLQVTVPYWTTGDVYLGRTGSPALLKLDRVNDVVFQGKTTLNEDEAYFYSRGTEASREIPTLRSASSSVAIDSVSGWLDLATPAGRSLAQEGLWLNACHFCDVSITKGNFIEPMGRSMDDIRAHGGTWVSLMPWWFVTPDITGNTVEPIPAAAFEGTSGWVTSTIQDADLEQLVGMAHQRGLKVYVCPSLATENWGPSNPLGKGDLAPTDPDAFFASYTEFVKHYAALAERSGVDMLCVGSENDTLSQPDLQPTFDKSSKWRTVIAEARSLYSGTLTYSVACQSEQRCGPEFIEFWDALDVIGWEWYVPIATTAHESIVSMKANAQRILENHVRPLSVLTGKPVVLTEVGWEAYPGACAHSFTGEDEPGSDRTEQASCYEAMFQALQSYPEVQGAHVWGWTANLPGTTFPWVDTDSVNEVRFSITEGMIDKWFKFFGHP